MNGNFERLNAIRRMLNAPDGEKITLSNGEVIQAWSIFDDVGNEVGIEIVPKELLERFYKRSQEWSCPDDCK